MPQGTVYIHFDRHDEHSFFKELAVQTKLGPVLSSVANDYSPIQSNFFLTSEYVILADYFL